MTLRHLHPYASPASTEFRNIVSAEGVRLTDSTGHVYIDAMASLWYCQVGHGNTKVIDAIAAQLKQSGVYNTFAPWGSPIAEQAAQRVGDLSPLKDSRVFFCCSGSEAIDTALKIARGTAQLKGESDRQVILKRTRGYHGVNWGGTSAQGIAAVREGWGDLLPHFVEIDPDDIESAARAFSEYGTRIAAVVTEPVQGAGGVWPPQDGYLQRLREMCDKHGSLLIFDEVICGFGRTGEWFGAQTFGVQPDLITFAKGVTSGYQPVGGVIVSRAVCEVLEADPAYKFNHGYTYSGHQAGMAAVLANIDVMEELGLIDRAKEIGVRFKAGLDALKSDGSLADVRGVGAVWGAQLTQTDAYDATTAGNYTVAVRDRMLDHGVIGRPIGNTIAFCPPLTISDADIDIVIDALATSLGEVAKPG